MSHAQEPRRLSYVARSRSGKEVKLPYEEWSIAVYRDGMGALLRHIAKVLPGVGVIELGVEDVASGKPPSSWAIFPLNLF